MNEPDCILCGVQIQRFDSRASWLQHFRAVRRANRPNGRAFVTGIGVLHMGVGNDYTEAPSDYNKHLRRDGYTLTDDDRFWTLVSRGPPLGAGFLFHVECWELLRTCFHPHEVPAERFFDLCASFPIISRDRQLEWGHDHGGFRKKIQTRYPWEECRTQLGNAILNYPPYYNEPPLGITDLDDVFDSKAPAGFADNPVSHRFQKQRDCFSILPVEICLEVLISLPSKDVKNLRKASRSFARISLPQMFWVSRFARGFERDYLFDVKLLNSNLALNEKLDAKSIYYQTIPGRILCGGLTNRRRIWKFLRELVAVLSIKREEHVSPLPGSWNSGDLAWRQVHGAIPTRDEWTRRHERPCKPIYERVAYVPTNIERVFVSTVTFNENEWISGFRVVGQDGKTVCFGYIYPESETSLDLTGEDGKPGVLTGFVTAVGPAGIHALRATMLDGRSTPWVGVPEMAPKSLRLCMGERITHIKALFDGFKMVSLAVPDRQTPNSVVEAPLRESALWEPDIPPKGLCLYDNRFPSKILQLQEYRPLIHLMFGGQKGAYLRYLTNMFVVNTGDLIGTIGFEYKAPGAPVARMEAGQIIARDARPITFPINGPGGEIVISLRVGGSPNHFYAISSLEVTTNLGRRFMFEPSAIPSVGLNFQAARGRLTYSVPPGKAITGLYLMHDRQHGMMGLGPISEDFEMD